MTIPASAREHVGDSRAIERLIAARVLSPAARSMTVPDIAAQHNGANPDPQHRIDPARPLREQVDRLIAAEKEA